MRMGNAQTCDARATQLVTLAFSENAPDINLNQHVCNTPQQQPKFGSGATSVQCCHATTDNTQACSAWVHQAATQHPHVTASQYASPLPPILSAGS